MRKWTLEQFTSDDGEKFDELRWDGVIAMLLPRGCIQMGWEGGDLKRFLRVLNAHEPMLAALKEIAESPHRSYENAKGDYGLGVADGHRFCANVAAAALANGE